MNRAIPLGYRSSPAPFFRYILSNPFHLFIDLLIQTALLIHIKSRQKIISHQNYVNVSQINSETPGKISGQLCGPAVTVAICQKDIEIIRFKSGTLQEFLYQLRHLMAEHRTYDADAICPIQLFPVMNRLGNADGMFLQLLCSIQTVPGCREIEYHSDSPPSHLLWNPFSPAIIIIDISAKSCTVFFFSILE